MANSHPPPKAKPFTQAIMGLGEFSILKNVSWPAFDNIMASALFSWLNSLISAPATKAFGPAPVMITDLIASFSYTSSIALFRSIKTAAFNAFSLSGRLMVMVKIPFSRFDNKVVMIFIFDKGLWHTDDAD